MITEADIVHIWLLEARLNFCAKLATWRQKNALRIGAVGRNQQPAEAAHADHEFGTPGEAAGMLFLTRLWNRPIRWNLYEFGKPDFEDWIDVKTNRRRYPINYLIVRPPTDRPEWAYVLAFPDPYPCICLFGWCWGHEAQPFFGDPLATGRAPACFVPQSAPCLKPMSQLRPNVRGAQQ